MKLKQLVEVLPAASVEGSLDGEVTGIAYDSRRVTPGMLFVAIPGQHADGHEFIANAVERGASAIICERNGMAHPRTTKIKVPDVREALARSAAAFYGNPSAGIHGEGDAGRRGHQDGVTWHGAI